MHSPTTQHRHFKLISKAIKTLCDNPLQKWTLDDLATKIGLSGSHFQRVFSEWVGLSPEQFQRYLSKERALAALQSPQSLLDTSEKLGLSSPSRLHDLTVTFEAMTPHELRSDGDNLDIEYGCTSSPFGLMFLAWTHRGICRLGFENETDSTQSLEDQHLHHLTEQWPKAVLNKNYSESAKLGEQIFGTPTPASDGLKVWVKGSSFQMKVWEALMAISPGQAQTYADVAQLIEKPNATRATGSAIGKNDIGFLIPCHRVIRANKEIGQYRWGEDRKHAILAWEACRSLIP